MDRRWEQPALTGDTSINGVAAVAERLDSIIKMTEGIVTWMLQEGVTDDSIKELRGIFAELHADERGDSKEDGPYDEDTIRTVVAASVSLRELAKFLELASNAFIVDYEMEYGGDS